MNKTETKRIAYSFLLFGFLCLWTLFSLELFLIEIPKQILYSLIFPGGIGTFGGISILIINNSKK